VLFLASSPPTWVRGAGAGAGAAVAAVAVHAGTTLIGPSRRDTASELRWVIYAVAGAASAAALGPWLVLVLIACGLVELVARHRLGEIGLVAPIAAALAGGGNLLSLAWVSLKVGALSYGGGFVIIPLMQGDAVDRYHWMTDGQFLNAVALGQVTPGPVVHTVAAVGYAAAGIGGGLLAAAVAFSPSFAFVLLGGDRFDRLRRDRRVRAFLGGAGPAAIGAILGSAIPLAASLGLAWQFAVLAAAAIALFALRRGVVLTLVGAAVAGVVIALAGGPLPH
jgi:chromate transporter